jgi:glycosyltransferase involved in cell wall biosynthesis
MRIGVVTTSYPRWPGDPAGNFVDGHARALTALGHTVHVIAAGDRSTANAPDVTRIASSLFYRGGAPDRLASRPARSALAALTFTARLTAATRARDADLLIAHWLVPSALAALPARAPLLAIAHGGDVHTLRRLGLLAPMLHALRARDARLAFVSAELLALARAAAPRLAPWLDRAAIVQPMGLDLARFAAIATTRATRAPSELPTIVIAARLVALKGIDIAIAALAHVGAPVQLVIAGAGPERAALLARATASPAAARIRFVGEVDTTARDELLRTADLVVVPSRVLPDGRTEGTPLIALEALASGTPVVASAVGGLRALAPAARLVPPDDPRALAAAIEATLGGTQRTPGAPDFTDLGWPQVAARLCTHAQVRIE